MKAISNFLKNIKNNLPYLLLIAIYFLFVNLEVKKGDNNKQNREMENILPTNNSGLDQKNIRIKIPVIPYN